MSLHFQPVESWDWTDLEDSASQSGSYMPTLSTQSACRQWTSGHTCGVACKTRTYSQTLPVSPGLNWRTPHGLWQSLPTFHGLSPKKDGQVNAMTTGKNSKFHKNSMGIQSFHFTLSYNLPYHRSSWHSPSNFCDIFVMGCGGLELIIPRHNIWLSLFGNGLLFPHYHCL